MHEHLHESHSEMPVHIWLGNMQHESRVTGCQGQLALSLGSYLSLSLQLTADSEEQNKHPKWLLLPNGFQCGHKWLYGHLCTFKLQDVK